MAKIRDLGYFLRWQGAGLSAGAAAVHFAEISPHFEEYWVFGGFFLAVAWFQAASAVAIVSSTVRRLVVVMALVNLAVVGIWIWSRTAGLPIGPEPGEPEAIGGADLLATVLEALFIAWCVAILSRAVGSRAASALIGVLTTILLWTVVAVMTAVVFATTGPVGAGH
jgi:hypothetical protein